MDYEPSSTTPRTKDVGYRYLLIITKKKDVLNHWLYVIRYEYDIVFYLFAKPSFYISLPPWLRHNSLQHSFSRKLQSRLVSKRRILRILTQIVSYKERTLIPHMSLIPKVVFRRSTQFYRGLLPRAWMLYENVHKVAWAVHL